MSLQNLEIKTMFCYQSFLTRTDAQENCFKRSTKIYIKITIAPTCFGVISIIMEHTE